MFFIVYHRDVTTRTGSTMDVERGPWIKDSEVYRSHYRANSMIDFLESSAKNNGIARDIQVMQHFENGDSPRCVVSITVNAEASLKDQ